VSGRSPAGPLMAEHRVIERMLTVLERQLVVIAETGRVDPVIIDTATDFIRTYADRCHHGKEEDILFRRLADKPLDDALARVMQGLIDDHVRGRSMTRGLIEANDRYRHGDTSALSAIESCVRHLVEFYPVHIATQLLQALPRVLHRPREGQDAGGLRGVRPRAHPREVPWDRRSDGALGRIALLHSKRAATASNVCLHTVMTTLPRA